MSRVKTAISVLAAVLSMVVMIPATEAIPGCSPAAWPPGARCYSTISVEHHPPVVATAGSDLLLDFVVSSDCPEACGHPYVEVSFDPDAPWRVLYATTSARPYLGLSETLRVTVPGREMVKGAFTYHARVVQQIHKDYPGLGYGKPPWLYRSYRSVRLPQQGSFEVTVR